MLSYRHGFHAGNHADVLKHSILCMILKYLHKKKKPMTYIDTHSGAGIYSLKSVWSQKTEEFTDGISKVIASENLNKLIPEYFETIQNTNDFQKEFETYPGSPYIAAKMCNEEDDLHLIELHPTEYKNLKYNMHYFNNVHVHNRSAEEGLLALLPPKIKRGLILIDPSYEMKTDYTGIVKLVKKAIEKFPQGVYAIWYPVLGTSNNESYTFINSFKKLNIQSTLLAELNVSKQEEFGMNGSGMIILNSPYGLFEDLQNVMEELLTHLRKDNEASIRLEYLNQPV